MARTIEEIKESMLRSYTENDVIQKKYRETSLVFSKTSLENIFFYVIAVMLWSVEVLFDRHEREVKEYIRQMRPHSLLWYVNKAKEFRYGSSLEKDTDTYSDIYLDADKNKKILSEEQIKALQIVKFAAAAESEGVVYLKAAKKGDGPDRSLNNEELAAFTRYIEEVKDAGVKVEIISRPADKLRIELDVYVNPMVINKDGKPLSASGTSVDDAIKNYISNLPFDGEYRNVDLVDALQVIDGVVIPELKGTWTSNDKKDEAPINAKEIPYSGYYVLDEEKSIINYFTYKDEIK